MASSTEPVIRVNIAASDHPVWSGDATYVSLPATSGGMGILPNHEPILSILSDGPITVTDTDWKSHRFTVRDGFVSFDDNRLTVAVEHSTDDESAAA